MYELKDKISKEEIKQLPLELLNNKINSKSFNQSLLQFEKEDVQTIMQSFELMINNRNYNSCNVKFDRRDKQNLTKEQHKAMKDNIVQTEENNQLTKYIQQNLDAMMIEYNKGLIIQMNLDEKRYLQKIIDENNSKKIE